jgi:hypothetical protein
VNAPDSGHVTANSDALDGYIDAALGALGGEDTEFYITVKDSHVCLQCRYRGCIWGEFVGEMELWEFVTDARMHWEGEHRQAAS